MREGKKMKEGREEDEGGKERMKMIEREGMKHEE